MSPPTTWTFQPLFSILWSSSSSPQLSKGELLVQGGIANNSFLEQQQIQIACGGSGIVLDTYLEIPKLYSLWLFVLQKCLVMLLQQSKAIICCIFWAYTIALSFGYMSQSLGLRSRQMEFGHGQIILRSFSHALIYFLS